MKTLFFAFTLLLLATGCDKKGSSSNNNANISTQQYSMRDGSCFDNSTQTYVANIYCQNNNGAYHMSNGNCYNRDGYQVPMENCNQNNGYNDDWDNGYDGGGGCPGGNCGGYGNGGGYNGGNNCISKSCYGSYIFTQGGYMQYGTCYGFNCRGYTLIEASTGQTVRCM